jgi:hypothetical protein
MHVAFLLGAGISRGLLPLSRAVDGVVLDARTDDGRIVIRHSDGSYLLQPEPQHPARLMQIPGEISPILRWLRERLGGEGSGGYELWSYACQQIRDALTDEFENPLLEPFLSEYRSAVRELTSAAGDPESLAAELSRYISGVVASVLAEPPAGVSEADLKHAHGSLLDCIWDQSVKRVDVVTLNHDCMLERSLRAASIPFEDGFGRPRMGSVARPTSAHFEPWVGYKWRRRRVRLTKLHGSIDWWRLRPSSGDWSEEIVARVTGYPYALPDSTGTLWDAMDSHPQILVGTTNKILDYARPFHLQRYALLRRILRSCDGLVVGGYSFRDKAVNGLLIDWFYRNLGKKLVVVDPSIEGSLAPGTARQAIAKKWASWLLSGRLSAWSTSFEQMNWQSIRRDLAATVRV